MDVADLAAATLIIPDNAVIKNVSISLFFIFASIRIDLPTRLRQLKFFTFKLFFIS